MLFEIDDFPGEHPNGIGLTFNHVVWQMLRFRNEYFIVNIRKPNNPYRDAMRGLNVWDYYFEQPSHNGMMRWSAPVDDVHLPALSGICDWDVRHQRALHDFASKHITLKPELRAEVELFKEKHFRGRVLGVHFRGTDKGTEYTPISIKDATAAVDALIERLKPDTVFLQTDDADYWRMMQRYNAVSLDFPRTKESLHHSPPVSPYDSGRCAVVDGFLGAACDWYAYTPSNFATISLIMGKHDEIHRINRHCKIVPFPQKVDMLLGL